MQGLLMEAFLPELLVMVDCEMTGVRVDRDKLLQVAMLKLRLDPDKKCYLVDQTPLVEYLHYSGQPESNFQRQYLSHIFKKCNESALQSIELKNRIHAWLGHYKGSVPCGDCVHFDIDFLAYNGCIDRPDIDKDGQEIPGTFHYSLFDIGPIKRLARQKAGSNIEAPRKLDAQHDALIDCYCQTEELNFYLAKLF